MSILSKPYFHDETAAYEKLESILWVDGPVCPHCGGVEKAYKIKANPEKRVRYGLWKCGHCRKQFTVTIGTVFEASKVPLHKWLQAVFLVASSKKGISANQLHRTLEVTLKTAWFMGHRIREAMGNDQFTGPTLFGIVEVDETFVGGKQSGKGRGPYSTTNKSIVVGAVQRDGKIRLERIENTRKATLHDFIKRTVKDEALAIYTDEFLSYRGIADHNTRHETVQHNINEWVVGDVHTNSVEGVWSLFKRSIMGSFHKISLKHMDRYLEELEWRINNRDNPHIFRDTLRRIMDTDALTYETLTA